jgi:hypothetical protein
MSAKPGLITFVSLCFFASLCVGGFAGPREKRQGLIPSSEASRLEELARRYQEKKDYANAEPLLKRVLDIRERTLPPDHPDVVNALRSLAVVYSLQNKWPDAEPLYDRLLAIPQTDAAANCGGVHRWGDDLRCYVTFKRKPQFSKLSVNFNLPSKEFAQPNPEQQGAFIGFQLANVRQIGRQTYEVSGVVSPCVPGIYVLSAISGIVPAEQGQDSIHPFSTSESVKGSRIYSNGFGFESGVAVRIIAPVAETVPMPPAAESAPKPNTQMQTGIVPYSSVVITPEVEANLAFERERMSPKVASINGDSPRSPKTASGQRQGRNCGGTHKPGDILNCYITFDRKTDFTSVDLLFSTPVGALIQGGLCNGFFLTNVGSADGQTFRVSGVMPWCTPAKYVLAFASGENAKYQVWQYRNMSDFNSDITIELTNYKTQTLFPDITGVGSEPPRNYPAKSR